MSILFLFYFHVKDNHKKLLAAIQIQTECHIVTLSRKLAANSPLDNATIVYEMELFVSAGSIHIYRYFGFLKKDEGGESISV